MNEPVSAPTSHKLGTNPSQSSAALRPEVSHPNAMSRIFVFALLAATLAGCVRPTHYTVAQRGSDVIALPPHADPTAVESHFEASIKTARSHQESDADCAIAGASITISWRGDTAEVQLDSGQLSTGDAVTFFDSQPARALLQALDSAQSKGCLGAGEEYRLKRALTQRLPLSSSLARTVLFGSFGLSGYVDLTPDLVLEFFSPIYPPGAAHIPGNLIGSETAHYSFARARAMIAFARRSYRCLNNCSENPPSASPSRKTLFPSRRRSTNFAF